MKPEGKTIEELEKMYEEELVRKDKIIERLREDNQRLIHVALLSAEKEVEVKEKNK